MHSIKRSPKSRRTGSQLAVVVHEFSLHQDGSWLTTGHDDIFIADCRHHAQSLSDRYGGHGKSIYVGGHTGEGCTELHSKYLVWDE